MLAVALSRLMPHPFNFTPVSLWPCMAAPVAKTWLFRFCCRLVVMVFSDILVMQFLYPENGNPFAYFITKDALGVYLAFGLVVCIGLLLKRNIKLPTVIVASLLSSFLFYAVTNFVRWSGNPFYPARLDRLMACYHRRHSFLQQRPHGQFLPEPSSWATCSLAESCSAHTRWSRRTSTRTAHA